MRFLCLTACLLPTASIAETMTVTAEIWSDNWFEMYVNGEKVVEDSVPITTERSFNAETARFEIQTPAQITIIAKDFKENDTGLEYIGTRRQQMGDGGLIAQIRNGAGDIVAVTDGTSRCLVIHHAPEDASCAESPDPIVGEGACGSTISDVPEGWMAVGFGASAWPLAVEYSQSEVRPKAGYDEIIWADAATLIWTESLTQDNTILCRLPLIE